MTDMMFADLLSRILEQADPEPEGGFDAPLWAGIENAGLDRLLLPEEMGGAGDAYGEAVAMMIAFGMAGAAVPLADTLVANWCLARAGLEPGQGAKSFLTDADLRNTSSGPAIVAYWLPVVSLAVQLVTAGEGAALVLHEDLAGEKGESLSGEPLSVVLQAQAAASGGQHAFGHAPEDALALAATLEAAAMIGALEQCCALSTEYANTRMQFGRQIGRFQAIQTHIARMASEAAAARAAVEHAAKALGQPGSLYWAAIAKSRASEAAGKAAAHAHQVHGAIGFTREYALQRHTRRLWTWRERRGNERYWNERIGAAALSASQDDLWPQLVDGLKL